MNNNKSYSTVFWLTFFLLMPHLKPAYFNDYMPYVEIIINVWQVVSFLCLMLLIIVNKLRVSKVILILIIMEIYVFLVTLFSRGNVIGALASAFSILTVALIYNYFCWEKEPFLSAVLLCFEIVIYINLFSIIIHPELVYSTQSGFENTFRINSNYFLGYYNTHDIYFIPALMIGYLYRYYSKLSIRCYLLTMVIGVSSILLRAGGILAAMMAIIIVCICFKDNTKVFNYYTYWIATVLFYLIVIRMKLINLIEKLTQKLFDRGYSFWVRTNIWNRTLEMIHNRFVFGYGMNDKVTTYNRIIAVHSHNLILQLLYNGGIIYLIFYSILVIVSGFYIFKYRNSSVAKIISVCFLGWCIHSTVEPFSNALLISMFVLAYNYGSMVRNDSILYSLSCNNSGYDRKFNF